MLLTGRMGYEGASGKLCSGALRPGKPPCPAVMGHGGEAWVDQSPKMTSHFIQAFQNATWDPVQARPCVGTRGLGSKTDAGLALKKLMIQGANPDPA